MKIFNSPVLIVSCLLTLSSCLENRKATSKSAVEEINQNETIEADGSNVQGNYAAEIWPINYNLHFNDVAGRSQSRQFNVSPTVLIPLIQS
jgi:hypothetical protein